MFTHLRRFLPVRASRLATATEKLRKCEARVEELKASLETARAASQEWKAKANVAEERLADVRRDAEKQAKLIERTQAEAARAEEAHARDVEQLRERVSDLGEKRARDAADLRAHLATTERDLAHAREHLMLIDTKLDILEGAANVLDNRTRAILRARATNPEVTSQ
jgi:chromosome segregation ATPase